MDDDLQFFTNLCGLVNKNLIKETDDEVDDPKPVKKRAPREPEKEDTAENAEKDAEKSGRKKFDKKRGQKNFDKRYPNEAKQAKPRFDNQKNAGDRKRFDRKGKKQNRAG